MGNADETPVFLYVNQHLNWYKMIKINICQNNRTWKIEKN
jgi:hypothetical protein